MKTDVLFTTGNCQAGTFGRPRQAPKTRCRAAGLSLGDLYECLSAPLLAQACAEAMDEDWLLGAGGCGGLVDPKESP